MKLTSNADAFLFSGGLNPGRERTQLFGCGFKLLLGPFALSDVLRRTEPANWPAPFIADNVTLTVKETHLSVGAHDTEFNIKAPGATLHLFNGPGQPLPVFRVDSFQPFRARRV